MEFWKYNGITTPKGEIRMMSSLLDLAVFLVIKEDLWLLQRLLQENSYRWVSYLCDTITKNANAIAESFIKRDYDIISGGTDNHMILIDLRNKGITGKEAENTSKGWDNC
jgi:glycine hydroxymethyltransferase